VGFSCRLAGDPTQRILMIPERARHGGEAIWKPRPVKDGALARNPERAADAKRRACLEPTGRACCSAFNNAGGKNREGTFSARDLGRISGDTLAQVVRRAPKGRSGLHRAAGCRMTFVPWISAGTGPGRFQRALHPGGGLPASRHVHFTTAWLEGQRCPRSDVFGPRSGAAVFSALGWGSRPDSFAAFTCRLVRRYAVMLGRGPCGCFILRGLPAAA